MTARIEIVRDADRLAEIGPAWDALWSACGALVFQSHGWISAWWRNAPDRADRSLRIGLIWEDERLLAILPLATHRRRGLVFLEWAANSHSDYGDLIAAAGVAQTQLDALWSRVCADRGFDIALINRLLPDARMRALVARDHGVRLQPNHRTETSHRVTAQVDGASWFEGQTKKARQNHRRGWKFLEDAGPVRFSVLGADAPRGPVLDRLAALKRQWLLAQGHSSALFEAGTQTLADLVEVLAQKQILRLCVLECGDAIVAVSVNFVQHGSMMAFVTSYDPAYERASPGTLLMSEYIKWAFDNGPSTVDFLCGAEAFKTRFATEAVELGTFAGAATLKGRLALTADEAQRALRAWRQRRTTSAVEQPLAA
ncbi:GNAT family N-acetyltransferase [Devosia sp. PTR5]|uniref:GNAT family N-acetyltransferase n=1 Tax=Devosia oryzisoli TaxID=2774138 RepID=A0A927FY38_9HYPH|nr:GNAT family N-acetyltransferase [Devosia oryzisoli]MBD8066759.1 GNAT family N-acetyltransferase [Devosia oryzisoli]